MSFFFKHVLLVAAVSAFCRDNSGAPSKVCFVNFKDVDSVTTSLHLTNTIFVDRALVISRSRYGEILIEAHHHVISSERASILCMSINNGAIGPVNMSAL